MTEVPTLRLSIVMPAYNEGEGLLLALDEIRDHVLNVVPQTEIIIVDDGSSDHTAERLADAAEDNPEWVLIRQDNAGHGVALRRGIDAARGDVLLLLDSDRQIGLDAFASHWAQFENQGLDALLGIRSPRYDPVLRLAITRIMRILIRWRFGRAPVDGGVPYKLVRRATWAELAPHIPKGCAIPSVLLAILLLNHRQQTSAEVIAHHRPRTSGQSVLRWRRLFNLCRDATRDILSLPRKIDR